MPSARTVLGDVPAADPGVCNSHDHLFLRTAPRFTMKAWVGGRLGQLTADLASGGRGADPELLEDQLSLIMEGTYALAQALFANGPARHARTVAESLLDVS